MNWKNIVQLIKLTLTCKQNNMSGTKKKKPKKISTHKRKKQRRKNRHKNKK